MIPIKKKTKVIINWVVSPYDFSKEKEGTIISKASKKYNLPKENIKVIPKFILLNEKGEEVSLNKDIIDNINDVAFQKKLFKEYLEINDIKDYNIDIINSIDDDINSKIDYSEFEKRKRLKLNWIKWDNFLSYGKDNFFNFSDLKGLVLLHGEAPYQNQSGKTTFAIDLFHFLLFGKTSKTESLSQIFNKNLPEETEVHVEGSISIEDEEYVIKRTITRPSFKKRTAKSKASQKISYYKINKGGEYEELADCEIENLNEENVVKTNKIIKDSIGNESDFDLMICATSSNLDDLISMKDTERGKLLTRWIGLLPLEKKDEIARKKFNNEIKPFLLGNQCNREDILNANKEIEEEINKLHKYNDDILKDISLLEKRLKNIDEEKQKLSLEKAKVDETILNIDIISLKKEIDEIVLAGKNKRLELDYVEKQIKDIGEIDYKNEDYDNAFENKSKIMSDIAEIRSSCTLIKSNIKSLKESEYCPTCGRKYDNIDNSEKIEAFQKELSIKIQEGVCKSKELEKINKDIERLKQAKASFDERNKLIVRKSSIEVTISNKLSEYKEKNNLYNNILKNGEIIKKNNELNRNIINLDVEKEDKSKRLYNLQKEKFQNDNKLSNDSDFLNKNNSMLDRLEEENKLIKNWKLYLDIIGKNGISKMILRRALPIINSNIESMLMDICDFSVHLEITEKNEVVFYLIKNGVKSLLNSGSGFELTCASLALRSVLTKMSSLQKMNFLVLDEILGRVASSNYDNMKNLYDKILSDYDFILQVTHIEDVKDWHNTIITVSKKENISKLKITNQ